MKSREKALGDGEDAFPMRDHCTIEVRGYGTQQGTCKKLKSMEPRNALLEHLRLSLRGSLLCKSYVYNLSSPTTLCGGLMPFPKT